MFLGRHLYEEKVLPMLSALMVFSVGDSCIRNHRREQRVKDERRSLNGYYWRTHVRTWNYKRKKQPFI